MPTYTCKGSVRGACGVKHWKLGAALRHCAKDQRDCESVRGYSDRTVLRTDAPLTDGEMREIDAWFDNNL